MTSPCVHACIHADAERSNARRVTYVAYSLKCLVSLVFGLTPVFQIFAVFSESRSANEMVRLSDYFHCKAVRDDAEWTDWTKRNLSRIEAAVLHQPIRLALNCFVRAQLRGISESDHTMRSPCNSMQLDYDWFDRVWFFWPVTGFWTFQNHSRPVESSSCVRREHFVRLRRTGFDPITDQSTAKLSNHRRKTVKKRHFHVYIISSIGCPYHVKLHVVQLY
jgi:hypothetical protein